MFATSRGCVSRAGPAPNSPTIVRTLANGKYVLARKWIGRGPEKVTRPIMHVGVDVRRQAARRRRAFDLAVERFAVERFAVILRRALPERFAAVFSFALRAGFAFLFAVLAMFSLSFAQLIVCPKNESY